MAIRGNPNITTEDFYSTKVLNFPIQVYNFFCIQETYKCYYKYYIYIYIHFIGAKGNNFIQNVFYNSSLDFLVDENNNIALAKALLIVQSLKAVIE